jgi:hypothetical protein
MIKVLRDHIKNIINPLIHYRWKSQIKDDSQNFTSETCSGKLYKIMNKFEIIGENLVLLIYLRYLTI